MKSHFGIHLSNCTNIRISMTFYSYTLSMHTGFLFYFWENVLFSSSGNISVQRDVQLQNVSATSMRTRAYALHWNLYCMISFSQQNSRMLTRRKKKFTGSRMPFESDLFDIKFVDQKILTTQCMAQMKFVDNPNSVRCWRLFISFRRIQSFLSNGVKRHSLRFSKKH